MTTPASAPRPTIPPPPASAPAPTATDPAARPWTRDAERQRLALTYGRTKARRTAWVGFALTGVELVLSGLWVAHAQPLGVLEDLPPRIDPDYQPNVDGGAIAIGTITWASVIAFAPAIGRGGRFARMHPEIGRSIALRAVGWTAYAAFIGYGLYLQSYALVYTGSTKGMVGGAMALGVGSLLLLSIDTLIVAQQATRLAREAELDEARSAPRWSPLVALGPARDGGGLVLGARAAF